MVTSIGATEGMPTEARAPSARRIRSIGGGGSVGAFVKVTQIITAAKYIGDLYLARPYQTAASEIGINIEIYGATTNPLSIGEGGFAVKSKNSSSEDTWFIEGLLLG